MSAVRFSAVALITVAALSACGHHQNGIVPSTPSGGGFAMRQPQVVWTGPIAHTEFTIPSANSGAQAITAGQDGNMWFVESAANKIGRITMSGSITEFRIPTPASQPIDITRGPDGALWFTEYAGNAIGRITTSGLITTYHVPTPNSHPAGITEGSDGNIWFTESSANKVAKLTPTGVFTQYLLHTPNSVPYGITDGTDHRVYFGNQGASYIGQITPSTGAITQIVITGRARFVAPLLAPDGGEIWYTDVKNSQVGWISITGYQGPPAKVYNLTSGAMPSFIVNGPYGDVWYTDYSDRTVSFGTGASTGTTSNTTATVSTWTGSANGIAGGPDNNIWITETSTNKIGVSMPDPQGVVYWASRDVYGFADQMPNGPGITFFTVNPASVTYIAADSNGIIYTCCENNGKMILVYAPNSYGSPTPIRTLSGSNTTFVGPTAIAVGKNILYVQDSGHIDAFPVTANGNVPPARVLQQSGSIAADLKDNLYVGEGAAIKVFSSTATGNAAPIRTIEGSNTKLTSGFSISGVDRHGVIYALSSDDSTFYEFAPSANGNAPPSRSFVTGHSTFDYVGSVTDRNGNSYLAWSNQLCPPGCAVYGAIQEWNTSGTSIGEAGENVVSGPLITGLAVRTP